MTIAVYAAACLAIFAALSCAAAAWFAWKASRTASNLHSMTSLLGELHEIRDYMGKIDAWAKRINAREVMQERGRKSDGTSRSKNEQLPLSDPVSIKDELRRRAGLIAGQAARHINGSDE
jgi:hypothetical protein